MNRDGWTAVKNSDIYEIDAWEVRDKDGESIVRLHSEGGCESDPYGTDCAAMDEATAKRVASLLTALEGFDDPAALVASWRALREALDKARWHIAQHTVDYHHKTPTEDMVAIDAALAQAKELDR